MAWAEGVGGEGLTWVSSILAAEEVASTIAILMYCLPVGVDVE